MRCRFFDESPVQFDEGEAFIRIGGINLLGPFTWNKGKWRSQVRLAGRAVHLGRLDLLEQAHAAYRQPQQRVKATLHPTCNLPQASLQMSIVWVTLSSQQITCWHRPSCAYPASSYSPK